MSSFPTLPPSKLPQGYLVNWDVQRQVWDYLFGKEMYQVTKTLKIQKSINTDSKQLIEVI